MDTLATTAIESEREGKVTKRKYQEAVLSDFETGEQPAKRSILASTVRHSLQLEKSSSLAICVARQVAYILRGRVPGTPAAALKQMCNQIANAVDLMRHPVHNMTDVISLEQSIAMVMRGLGYATWISKCDYLLVGMFRSLAMRFFGLRLQVLSHSIRFMSILCIETISIISTANDMGISSMFDSNISSVFEITQTVKRVAHLRPSVLCNAIARVL